MKVEHSRRDVLKTGSFGMLGAGIAGNLVLGLGTSSGAMAADALGLGYADGVYKLPPLPYGYDALEPLYEERTLRIHHDKHHAGYVRGLNSTLEKLEKARQSGDYSSIKALSRDLAFNGSGHVLHTLFWNSMSPDQLDMPESLSQAITKSFGSVEAAKKQFAAATKAVEGSGWGVLAYEPMAEKLLIFQAEKHQNLTMWGVTPLLVCDVWEHAYYLQYANNRGEWVDNFFKMANWPFAAHRLEAVRKSTVM